jgi:hypothetical protein
MNSAHEYWVAPSNAEILSTLDLITEKLYSLEIG